MKVGDKSNNPNESIPDSLALNKSVDSELVNAISRSGDMKEALGGPLIYTVVLLLCTIVFFK